MRNFSADKVKILCAISAPERSESCAQFQLRKGQYLVRNFSAGKVKILCAISAPERSESCAQFQRRKDRNLVRNFSSGKVKIFCEISAPERSNSCAQFQASAAVLLRLSPFWVVNTTQVRSWLPSSRSTLLYLLQRPSSPNLFFLHFLTPCNGLDKLSRNVARRLLTAPRHIPEE